MVWEGFRASANVEAVCSLKDISPVVISMEWPVAVIAAVALFAVAWGIFTAVSALDGGGKWSLSSS